MSVAAAPATGRLIVSDGLGPRDEFLSRWRATLWEGGARYWRGRVMYRPVWAIEDVELHRVSFPSRVPALYARLIVVKRVDNNSASQPPGALDRLAPCCFKAWENYPGGAHLHQLVGLRARPTTPSTRGTMT